MDWQPISTRPQGANLTYLVTNKIGEVAPWINGVIHNNCGSPWDWSYGEDITHWMPLPPPPGIEGPNVRANRPEE